MFVAPVIFVFLECFAFLVFFCIATILSLAAVVVSRKLKFGQYLITNLRSCVY
jgi:hypothetical protein